MEDAHGQPPSIPFWLGESPARSDELSAAVSDAEAEVEERLGQSRIEADGMGGSRLLSGQDSQRRRPCSSSSTWPSPGGCWARCRPRTPSLPSASSTKPAACSWCIHAPFGSRVNRAWGLALRKRFCRQFNFELQAAATEDALLLSLGPQHSFPLESVFRFLHPETVGDILVQALLDAPMFGTHWRWNANIALAIPRSRGGRKMPPQIQRMQADDLLAAAFPDAAACLENIPGDREIPDHPLVRRPSMTACTR